MKELRFGVALCALAVAVAVAACGGGGGNSAPPANGGGGATPTPSPSPSPSPTPTPTYTAFDDLTGDETFQTARARGANPTQEFQVTFFDSISVNPVPTITYSFAEAAQNWMVTGDTITNQFNLSVGPTDISQDDPVVQTLYLRPSATGGPSEIFVLGTPQWPTAVADFVRGSFFQTDTGLSFNCVFGVPTRLDDPLPSSTITYSQEIDAAGTLVAFSGQTAASFDLAASTFTITADPTRGNVVISVDVKGNEFSFDANGNRIVSPDVTDFGTIEGTAFTAGNEQSLFADLSKATGLSFSGAVSGWFFGPHGEEIGLVFSGREQLTDGSQVLFSFGITAQRDP